METAVQILRSHHENFDGSGYPDGLSGLAIPPPSQLLRLADTYEALRSRRPYREAVTLNEAIAEIEREAGRAFDPALIEPFTRVIRGMQDVLGVQPVGRGTGRLTAC